MIPSVPAPGDDWLTSDEAREALRTQRGKGVRIALIDSGIDRSHPQLQALRLSDDIAIVEERGRIVAKEGDGMDGYGHGTAVAAILHEVAPEAQIGNFRVLDARNLSRSAVIREGARQALDRGYHIVNCSFGCRSGAKSIMLYKEWVDEAWRRGIHITAACNNFNLYEPEWPGHFSTVITVNMARTQSPHFFHRPRHMVQFGARGENVPVAWLDGRTETKTGSSFAAPRVAGLAARLLSAAPRLSPPLMLDLLRRIADPWHAGLECAPDMGEL
jgi:subtilisin